MGNDKKLLKLNFFFQNVISLTFGNNSKINIFSHGIYEGFRYDDIQNILRRTFYDPPGQGAQIQPISSINFPLFC